MKLSLREAQVLIDAAEGLSAVESGKRRILSPWTVKDYRKRVIAALGARNTTHAVALAFKQGLL